MNNILIIGNGESRLKAEDIDQELFDIIVHCNRVYPNFRKDVVFRNLNSGLPKETGLTWEEAVQFEECWLSFASESQHTGRKAIGASYKAQFDTALLSTGQTCNWRETGYPALKYALNVLSGATPTTGFMALLTFFMPEDNRVHITGFDFFGGTEKKGVHRPLREKAFIDGLTVAGGIERL